MNFDISRRKFLTGSAISMAGLVAACSDTQASGTPSLVALYNSDKVIAAGVPSQRIPFGVSENGTEFIEDDTELAVRLIHDGQVVNELTVKAHIIDHAHVGVSKDEPHEHSDLTRYFPLRANLEKSGIYDLEIDFPNGVSTLAIQAFPKSETTGFLPGQKFPEVKTPTEADPAGVDNICTRVENCGLHSKSASELLGQQAFALLIATPAFCSTSYCGPVLETLLDVIPEFSGLEFVHAEVYANTKEVNGDYSSPDIKLAPLMKTLDLTYEPALFLVNSDGKLVDRIDNVYDKTELRSALSSLV